MADTSIPSVVVDDGEPMPIESITPEIPNGGFGWVVVVSSFVIHVLVLGNVYSFGVFLPAMVKDLNTSVGQVAWIGSIGFGICTGIAPYTGGWADRYGNNKTAFVGGVLIAVAYLIASLSTEVWHLYITQGVIAGVGYSMSFVSAVSVVSQWFTTRRGLAVGMAVSGSGLGQFAIALITGALIENLGWRASLQILAIISFVGISIASLTLRRHSPCFTPKATESSLHFFRDRNFAILYVAILFTSLGCNCQFVHIANYALVHGLSLSQATTLVAVMGIASAAGRVVLGYAADSVGKLNMLKACTISAVIVNFSWIACTDFASLVVFALLFGFFGGGFIALIPNVCSLLFGLEKQGNVMGVMLTATAIGNLLSSPIAGFIFDVYKEYYPSILVAGAFNVIGVCIIFFVHVDDSYHRAPTATDSAKNLTVEDDAMAAV